jgi:hypothetical protein
LNENSTPIQNSEKPKYSQKVRGRVEEQTSREEKVKADESLDNEGLGEKIKEQHAIEGDMDGRASASARGPRVRARRDGGISELGNDLSSRAAWAHSEERKKKKTFQRRSHHRLSKSGNARM